MKNKVLQVCIAGAVLSASSLAFGNQNENDNNSGNNEGITDAQMLTYSIISGAAVSIAAQPALHDPETKNVGGQIAAKAAVSIGANASVNDLYAGAAVTTGAGSQVKRIYAGAAVTIGATGRYDMIDAGAAKTYGAGSVQTSSSDEQNHVGIFENDTAMSAGIGRIEKKFEDTDFGTYNVAQDLSGFTYSADSYPDGVVRHSDITMAAGGVVTIVGDVTFVTSGAVTLGAGAVIELSEHATVTWIIGGALNLGADSDFSGVAYVRGAVNGATSDVGSEGNCANIYAFGAVSIRSIGEGCGSSGPVPVNSCAIIPETAFDSLIARTDALTTYVDWLGVERSYNHIYTSGNDTHGYHSNGKTKAMFGYAEYSEFSYVDYWSKETITVVNEAHMYYAPSYLLAYTRWTEAKWMLMAGDDDIAISWDDAFAACKATSKALISHSHKVHGTQEGSGQGDFN